MKNYEKNSPAFWYFTSVNNLEKKNRSGLETLERNRTPRKIGQDSTLEKYYKTLGKHHGVHGRCQFPSVC